MQQYTRSSHCRLSCAHMSCVKQTCAVRKRQDHKNRRQSKPTMPQRQSKLIPTAITQSNITDCGKVNAFSASNFTATSYSREGGMIRIRCVNRPADAVIRWTWYTRRASEMPSRSCKVFAPQADSQAKRRHRTSEFQAELPLKTVPPTSF